MGIKVFVIIRMLIGCIFVVSGFEKLIGPYQHYLYVFHGYYFIPTLLDEFVLLFCSNEPSKMYLPSWSGVASTEVGGTSASATTG